MDDRDKKLHIIMLPWLAFGHILPFFKLSKYLAQKGHSISFISTPRNISRLPKIPQNLSSHITLVKFSLPTVDGLPENAEATSDIVGDAQMNYLKKAYDGLQDLMADFIKDSVPNWIVFDFSAYWVPEIAAQLGVKCVFFCVFSALAFSFLGSPSKYLAGDSSESPDLYRLATGIEGAHIVAQRSCFELEPDALIMLKENFKKPVLPVGLLLPPLMDLTEEEEIADWVIMKDWLDKQEQSSVIYIAFGSEITLCEQEWKELTFGIEKSGLPFFWVVRSKAMGESEYLVTELEERVGDRGFICREWAPQLKILAHSSIGGFVTHCGWGSITEGLAFGIALVLFPVQLDQGLNARVFESKKVGLKIPRNEQDGSFTSDSVAESIRRVVVDEEGELIRENAREMSKLFGDRDKHTQYLDEFTRYLVHHTH